MTRRVLSPDNTKNTIGKINFNTMQIFGVVRAQHPTDANC